MSRVEAQARSLLKLSAADARSWLPSLTVAVLERAAQLERKQPTPRISLISAIRQEIALQKRRAARAPKDAA